MKFAIVGALIPTEELLPLAVAADELGYDSFCVGDHVVDLETISTPYPYEADGSRRWDSDCEWPDPWVLFGAMGAVTTRLTFFTSIYVAALRSPYQVAKSVGTAAVLTGGRIRLGVGAGWCTEEFDLLEQDFDSRGRRTDEGLARIRALWENDWVDEPRLTMRPRPAAQVPILVGGMTPVAMRRAARYDGWVGDISSTDDAIAVAARLRAVREQTGEADRPAPTVIAALNDALLPADFERAEAGGVTDVMTQPWMYYHGRRASLEQKIDGMERFAKDVLGPLGVH
ncbi:MAG: TIGR03619 family F420-dependent LLM class oxidoreductase [Marmoricola sp.]